MLLALLFLAPILTTDHVWVCPREEPTCFGVPVTLAPVTTLAPPVTLDPPALVLPSDMPPLIWVADDPAPIANPEPTTLLLVGATLAALGWRLRR